MQTKVDKLTVKILDSRAEMGKTAAEDICATLKALLGEKEEVNMIFAAAPSQNEVLASLCECKDVDWSRVNAFHMDEYIGIARTKPQSFGNFLEKAIFGKLPFRSVNYIDGTADAEIECRRYTELLAAYPCDIVVMGIGENGHIAFNDPPVADFEDKTTIKPVQLDDICRNQQVHDGCFPTLADVPTHALTLTCPTLAGAKYQFCIVPAPTKAKAVKSMLTDGISTKCPATILRTCEHATLYLEPDSAALI